MFAKNTAKTTKKYKNANGVFLRKYKGLQPKNTRTNVCFRKNGRQGVKSGQISQKKWKNIKIFFKKHLTMGKSGCIIWSYNPKGLKKSKEE